MAPLCNVGLCFNPCAQQKIFCQGRLALIRPAVVQPFRLRRAQHRQAHRGSHCLSFVGLPLSHLSRSTEEANPPSGRVFLSAFAPQKPHSFPMGKPRFAPLPPRRIRLTPFPQSCHGFVLAPSSRQKPRQPRVSANLCCGVVHSRAEPDKNPSSDTRKGFLWAQLFRSHEQPFLAGESLPARTVTLPSSDFRPLSADLCALSPAAAFGKIPPLLRRRRSGSPAGGAVCLAAGFRLRRFRPSALQRSAIPPRRGQFPSFGTFSSNLWNFVRNFSNPWKIRPLYFSNVWKSPIGNRHSPMHGAPAARAPHKMGPRALRALLFPDIYREIETP